MLNPRHIGKLPRDFCYAGLIYSLPLITIAAATAFGWMLAYLRGAIVISDVITSLAGSDPHLIMLLLVLLFTIVGDFIEPVPTIIIFMPLVNSLTDAGSINPGAHGRGADRHPGLRPDHAALRAGAADGVEIRRRAVLEGAEGRAADLCRVPRHHRVHDLRAERHPVAAQARDAAGGRLLQESQRQGYICPP